VTVMRRFSIAIGASLALALALAQGPLDALRSAASDAATMPLPSNSVAFAQAKSARYANYDVAFDVRPDGTVDVVEDQLVAFESGPFKTGYVTLETRGAESIEVTGVAEPDLGTVYTVASSGESPGTYRVSDTGDEIEVRWWFADATDARRRFEVRYTLHGALRFYEGGDQLWWKAIRPERPLVEGGQVTVSLPADGPGPDKAVGYRLPSGAEIPMRLVDEHTAALELPELPSGDEVEVRVQWPHGAIAGTPSAFQPGFDASRAGEQALIDATGDPTRALVNIVAALLALLVGVGGLVGLYVMWYTRGRDEPVDLPVDYLAEPPSDLPPGVVGTLVDERGDLRDVLATLIDLARRGELVMEERVEKGFMGFGERRDFVFRSTRTGAPLTRYEELVLDGVFDGRDVRELSDLKNEFYSRLPEIQGALYEAAVDEGLFASDPEGTRTRYSLLAVLGFVATGLVLVGGMVAAQFAPAILCLPVSLGIVSAGALVVARYMPRKTPAGAEAAARWAAFKRYLANIEQYRDLTEASDIFERYLPYAIAFGLDQEWIAVFAKVDADVPPWYMPWPHGGGYGRPWVDWGGGPSTLEGPGPGTGGAGAGRGGSAGPAGSLGRASTALGGGLSSMSTGLASMLNTAAVVMTSRPAPQGGSGLSGGSWSGGGFSAGGGGGGGGGGFG